MYIPQKGDRVKLVGTERPEPECRFVDDEHLGHLATVRKSSWGDHFYVKCDCGRDTSCMPAEAMVKINAYKAKEQKMPTIAKNLRLSKLDDDTKVLLKAGIVNEDGSLTEQGVQVVHDYAFNAHKDAILADLKALLAKQESK